MAIHTTKVGRYTVRNRCNMVTLSDGTPGLTYEELGRLESRAAKIVLSKVQRVGGQEVRFARKALGLTKAELGDKLGVTQEEVDSWEKDQVVVPRYIQLAVLSLFLPINLEREVWFKYL
jgi:DNA-binding XRE family transcriptional regulator